MYVCRPPKCEVRRTFCTCLDRSGTVAFQTPPNSFSDSWKERRDPYPPTLFTWILTFRGSGLAYFPFKGTGSRTANGSSLRSGRATLCEVVQISHPLAPSREAPPPPPPPPPMHPGNWHSCAALECSSAIVLSERTKTACKPIHIEQKQGSRASQSGGSF